MNKKEELKDVFKTSGVVIPRGTYDIVDKKDLETMRYELT